MHKINKIIWLIEKTMYLKFKMPSDGIGNDRVIITTQLYKRPQRSI